MNNQFHKYAIRTLAVGVASVTIGLTGVSHVSADTEPANSVTMEDTVETRIPIPYTTEYITDFNLLSGEEIIEQAGVDGYKDAATGEILQEPVTKIIRQGMAQKIGLEVTPVHVVGYGENNDALLDPEKAADPFAYDELYDEQRYFHGLSGDLRPIELKDMNGKPVVATLDKEVPFPQYETRTVTLPKFAVDADGKEYILATFDASEYGTGTDESYFIPSSYYPTWSFENIEKYARNINEGIENKLPSDITYNFYSGGKVEFDASASDTVAIKLNLLGENYYRDGQIFRILPIYSRLFDIPFGTVYAEDRNLDAGESRVVDGRLGKTAITHGVTGDATFYGVGYTVFKPVDSVIYRGVRPKVVEEELPFDTVRRPNPNLAEGIERVVTEGVAGHKKTTTTYVLNVETGEVTPNEPVVEVTEKVDKIVEYGTGRREVPGNFPTVKLPVSPISDDVIQQVLHPKVEEEELPFDTIRRPNPNLAEGTERVVTEGVAGHKKTTTTYTFNIETGEAIANEPVVEVTEKVDKIVEYGTGRREVPGNFPTVKLPVSPISDDVIQQVLHPKVEEEELPFDTIRRPNPNLAEGTERVVTEGVAGHKKTTTT
ncbi:G5 domain-containing protein, partial [Streptococcus marmotae]